MRRTTITAVLIATLLVATFLIAQEKSPLVVDTGKPTPTIVKTDETIIVNYRVRWLDLVAMGHNKEIEIFEDTVQPENLSVEPFEIVNLEVGPIGQNGNELYRDYTYTFRIISPKKSDEYIIPKIKFFWLLKKAGEKLEENHDMREFETQEIPITYISTITKGQELRIRDEFILDNHQVKSLVLRIFPFLFLGTAFIWMAYGFVRSNRLVMTERGELVLRKENSPTPFIVRRNFYKTLNGLKGAAANFDHEDSRKVRLVARKLYGAVQEILLAELPGLDRSYSVSRINDYILEKIGNGRQKDALLHLVRRMRHYRNELNGTTPRAFINSSGLEDELEQLRSKANELIWYRKLTGWFRSRLPWRR